MYINEGYDVMNVEDMKIVLFFYGGVIGVWVVVLLVVEG